MLKWQECKTDLWCWYIFGLGIMLSQWTSRIFLSHGSVMLYSCTIVLLSSDLKFADVVCFKGRVAWSICPSLRKLRVNTSFSYCFRNDQFCFSFSNLKPPVVNMLYSGERHALVVIGGSNEKLVVSVPRKVSRHIVYDKKFQRCANWAAWICKVDLVAKALYRFVS